MNNLIFVDVEATGPCPGKGVMTEFGAVHYPSLQPFHGKIVDSHPDPSNPALSITDEPFKPLKAKKVMEMFEAWLKIVVWNQRPIFVSDNPAFDWQWINYFFHHYSKGNPFGHSGRRISDFYSGLVGDFSKSQKWKKLRITPHDHNPVHDALGNVEAFDRLLKGERPDEP